MHRCLSFFFFFSFVLSFFRSVIRRGRERERERESLSKSGTGAARVGGLGGRGGRGWKEKVIYLADFIRGSRLIWWRLKRGTQIPRRIFD